MEFLENLLNLKTVVGVLFLVIWIGYLIFAFTLVGKVNFLARVLKTNLSGINQLAAWVHVGLVLIFGLIGILLLIF